MLEHEADTLAELFSSRDFLLELWEEVCWFPLNFFNTISSFISSITRTHYLLTLFTIYIYIYILYIYILYIYIYICNSSKSTFCTKRSRVQHWRKVYCHWTTPKHKAKQRKHHRILKERENVWIKKLETLHLKGLVDIKKSQIEYSQRNI